MFTQWKTMLGELKSFSRTAVLAVLVLGLGLRVTGCVQPSPTPTATAALPTATLSPPTATPTTQTSPLATPSPTATPTTQTSPLANPSPTATTETSPLLDASLGDLAFDGDSAYTYVLEQCAFGPRPTGSEAGWATGDYLAAQLEALGWQVVVHAFTYGGVQGRNIIGQQGTGPVAMLGAHYDTRPYADHNPEGERAQWILGANDGASGVAVLLELARVLEVEKTGREIWLAFFDAEDRGNLDGWPFSVGATMLARDLAQSNLPELTHRPEFVIVVDMVGDADQQLYYEGYSHPKLSERLWTLAHSLGYGSTFVPTVKHYLIDDHRPFLEIGIPAVDIIDFDYPYWHTTEDTADKVSPASLERVGRVLEQVLESGGTWQP
ncbi:MAG: M28 family peptidase [Anaerolineae bacterium]|nr:MAG: M28 family peptidase [Anaerolineae bacterium]